MCEYVCSGEVRGQLEKLALSFYDVGPRAQPQIVRVGIKQLYPLSWSKSLWFKFQ